MIKILLIDDDEDFVEILSQRLERRNFPANVALNGNRAIRLVTNEVPDVVVLDLKMPGFSGTEVLRHLKQINPDIQVIVLTGHGSEQARLETMLLGAYEYLEKPVKIDTLVQTIIEAYQAKEYRKQQGS